MATALPWSKKQKVLWASGSDEELLIRGALQHESHQHDPKLAHIPISYSFTTEASFEDNVCHLMKHMNV